MKKTDVTKKIIDTYKKYTKTPQLVLQSLGIFSQILLLGLAWYGYEYTVKPLYEHQLLIEKLSETEINLAKQKQVIDVQEKAMKETYIKIKNNVTQYVAFEFVNCVRGRFYSYAGLNIAELNIDDEVYKIHSCIYSSSRYSDIFNLIEKQDKEELIKKTDVLNEKYKIIIKRELTILVPSIKAINQLISELQNNKNWTSNQINHKAYYDKTDTLVASTKRIMDSLHDDLKKEGYFEEMCKSPSIQC